MMRRWTFVRSLFWLSVAVLLSPFAVWGQDSRPVVRVGMVFDGPWSGNDQIRSLTAAELKALVGSEIDVRFPEESTLVGDWSFEATGDAVRSLLGDPSVDLVIAWGVLASQTACCVGTPEKPLIAPLIIDVDLQNVPFVDGTSGVHNLSYVTFQDNTAYELRVFRDIVPFDRVVFLAQYAILDALPELEDRTRRLLAPLGIEASYVKVRDSAAEALAAIPDDAQAVYVWPQFQFSEDEMLALVQGLKTLRLPTFAALADSAFEAGLLATMTSDDFFRRLSRRVALNAQRILLGEDASELPVDFPVRSRLRLNVATAQAIGVSPRWEMLIEADVIGSEDLEGFESISFDEAVREAVDANLDIRAQNRALAASAQDAARARALRWPQLDVSLGGAAIDDDRGGPVGAERSVSGSLGLSQVIYDDSLSANVAIQDQLQLGRRAALRQLQLDVALETATAYVNLLRSVSLAEVQRTNLDLTRSNLERAEIRQSVGAANPAEVYRWQNQIANDRRALIDARAATQQAEIALSRLLARPLDSSYRAVEVDLDDPLLITGEARLEGYLETPEHFRTFSDFTVSEGLLNAPELEQLRTAREAEERRLATAERAFYLPQVVLQGSLEEVFSEGGAGAGLEPPDDTSWSLSLGASLPIFKGGSRRADRIQSEETLARLEHELQATSDLIEQRIRIAMLATRASFAGIELTEEAANAARRNLDLVADAYGRGAVSIVDLLDAQGSTLLADQAATNAVHDFLVDLMELQRAADQFDFFTSPSARSEWFVRLQRYFEDRDVRPWPRAQEEE